MVRIAGMSQIALTRQSTIDFLCCRETAICTYTNALKIKFEGVQQQLCKIALKISVTEYVLIYAKI